MSWTEVALDETELAEIAATMEANGQLKSVGVYQFHGQGIGEAC